MYHQIFFEKIPGIPRVYSISKKLVKLFEKNKVSDFCDQKMRISTGDNERFVRIWFEVSNMKLFYPRKWVAL